MTLDLDAALKLADSCIRVQNPKTKEMAKTIKKLVKRVQELQLSYEGAMIDLHDRDEEVDRLRPMVAALRGARIEERRR